MKIIKLEGISLRYEKYKKICFELHMTPIQFHLFDDDQYTSVMTLKRKKDGE